MARHTKLKLAALATALVATMGIAGASTAASVDAGKTTVQMSGDHSWCC